MLRFVTLEEVSGAVNVVMREINGAGGKWCQEG